MMSTEPAATTYPTGPTLPSQPIPSPSTALIPTAPDADADPLGDEIAALCAHISAATSRLLTLLRVFDEEGAARG